ncbi:MAG: LytS/YhcK type 5TM receptor domain-containing protein, partial [Methylococcales bacterium]
MHSSTIDILFHWSANTPELLQRACVVIVVTYLAIRQRWFRRAMRGVDNSWRHRIVAAFYFGALAVVGTHNGIVLDISRNGATIEYLSRQPAGLQHLQAILSFRDMLVMSAGLFGGPWTGLGAGLIAGGERWLLGGFVGFASGFSTLLLGLGAGLASRVWPGINCRRGTLAVVLAGTAVQKFLIVFLSTPQALAIATIKETIIPETTVNCLGCLLFLSVLQDMERDRLKAQAQQAELRALRAQIEPHFINNTLNAIKALIRRDPEQASDYVVKLARFLDDTRQIA